MKTLVGKFTFKVPDDSPVESERGKKVEKAFEYRETENDIEAQAVMTEKKWSLKDMVDEALKANARSNAYQSALLPHKPSEVPQEDIKERMIRDYIRLGIPENIARAQVESTLAAMAEQSETAPSA
jgi:Glu-tRNA(Gln) amidotransferase subunit E-like FAD-binding protein